MKVLHVVHNYAPAVGGTQWMVQQLSERLVAQYSDDVTVFTTVAYSNAYFWDRAQPAMKPGTERLNGVTLRRFPVFNRFGQLRLLIARVGHKLRLPGEDWARGLYFGPLVPGLTTAVATSGADVVMASAFPLLHMHNALAGGKRAGMPVVLFGALHPADPWCFDRKMIFQAIEHCDAYVAYTDFERDYLGRRGIRADKVVVIGGGVDPAAFGGVDGSAVRQRRGWGADPIIATVAQHLPHKRIDLLIKAMWRVWETHPAARLLVIGRPASETDQLVSLIHGYPVERQERIALVTEFSQADKAELLAACDVFAMLSSHESFGLVFLEAWACGKPVIGSAIGAVPGVIDEGVDGLLVPYGDADAAGQAICQLLGDPEARAGMGSRGRAKVRARFSWDAIVPRFRETYLAAIRTNRGAHKP